MPLLGRFCELAKLSQRCTPSSRRGASSILTMHWIPGSAGSRGTPDESRREKPCREAWRPWSGAPPGAPRPGGDPGVWQDLRESALTRTAPGRRAAVRAVQLRLAIPRLVFLRRPSSFPTAMMARRAPASSSRHGDQGRSGRGDAQGSFAAGSHDHRWGGATLSDGVLLGRSLVVPDRAPSGSASPSVHLARCDSGGEPSRSSGNVRVPLLPPRVQGARPI